MKFVMNSAIMTSDGVFRRTSLSREGAASLLRKWGSEVVSAVGYQATADHIYEISGVRLEVSRGSVEMQPGDQALVVKLRQRVQDPAQKGTNVPGPDDWEYILVDDLVLPADFRDYEAPEADFRGKNLSGVDLR